MEQSIQVFLGVPKTSIQSVFTAQQQQRVILKQIIFRNSLEVEAKVTVSINTVDVMTVNVKGGSSEIRDTFIVLKPGDTLFLQQEKENAINVTIGGIGEKVLVNEPY
ncbi:MULTISPECIES: hypothetical protein [Bacillus cereus group]|uniref:hypothetical protein n=1 Tax=Bacillus cereus group TaxID=86661 RepID=UPI0018A14D10|nr:hypothetical protein [Bacillus albus]MBF7155704.1 hypothetical protein [Bacillus albus]